MSHRMRTRSRAAKAERAPKLLQRPHRRPLPRRPTPSPSSPLPTPTRTPSSPTFPRCRTSSSPPSWSFWAAAAGNAPFSPSCLPILAATSSACATGGRPRARIRLPPRPREAGAARARVQARRGAPAAPRQEAQNRSRDLVVAKEARDAAQSDGPGREVRVRVARGQDHRDHLEDAAGGPRARVSQARPAPRCARRDRRHERLARFGARFCRLGLHLLGQVREADANGGHVGPQGCDFGALPQPRADPPRRHRPSSGPNLDLPPGCPRQALPDRQVLLRHRRSSRAPCRSSHPSPLRARVALRQLRLGRRRAAGYQVPRAGRTGSRACSG
ncbi:hypothetical protein DFJ74DRAFT_684212 [Hyaloraphidium curvatum]|nr:hypothetical protein DFJ74DRAFT_684212 [Hyaloraphidium curvatum]